MCTTILVHTPILSTRALLAAGMAALRELHSEATAIVEEVEEAVMAEPGLDDEQRTWLRASAYDCYDM